MDRLETMRIFLRVAELANFSRAAETLGLPKATISNAVQRLEGSLGTRLLQRTTRRVQLTQDGALFYERCRDLLADAEEISNLFQRGPAKLSGRIRIDMSTGVARNIVIPKLPEFLGKYPAIELEVSSTDRRVDLVREGFDCVVRIGELGDSGLIARHVGHFRLLNCASPAYLKKFGRPRKPADLEKHRLVHYTPTLGMKPEGFEYVEDGVAKLVAMKGAISVNNADAYLASCLAGLGIVQVPEIGVREHLQEGRLVEILPEYRAVPMPVSIIYPHRRNLARRVQLFLNWLESIMREYAHA